MSCNYLQLQTLRPVLYSLRHGGASHDMLNRIRPLEEIKKRGRWRSDASLRRYTKGTRVLSELKKVAPQTLTYGQLIMSNLHLIFDQLMPVPQPPAPVV